MVVLLAPPPQEVAKADPASSTSTFGELTVTENLIRQEILRLNGDWESGSKPKLVAFLGKEFKSNHYEMLSHLPTLEYFFVQNGSVVDNYAVKCLSTVTSLKRLDFVRCEFDTTCLSLLDSNRDLRELNFEEVNFTDSLLHGMTQLNRVEKLTLSHVDLSDVADKSIDRIARMESLKKCQIWDCRGVSSERIKQLTREFPNIEWK